MRRCLSCSTLILTGSRCKACRERRRPASARYTLPRLAKQRDGYRCTLCGSTANLEVHHRTPIAYGGSHDLSNLVTLCKAHHYAVHEFQDGR